MTQNDLLGKSFQTGGLMNLFRKIMIIIVLFVIILLIMNCIIRMIAQLSMINYNVITELS